MNFIKHIPKSISKLHKDIFPIYANGSYIFTKNKKYLDLTSGIGALSTGHNHPLVVDKVKQQLDKYVHIPQQVFQSHPIQVELTNKILKTLPSNKLNKLDNIFYVNSGSEATDNAIKLARIYTGKSNIIALNKGFHGRTLGALSITSSNTKCKNNISPLLSNIFFCKEPNQESLNNIFNHQSAPEETSAIILEPVQGEAGIFSIKSNFLKYVQEICYNYNILLIIDEVQCGSMRTGSWWNFEEKEIIPDILTFGKGIASGYPLAGIIANSSIMNRPNPGMLGGTYGGNAICSAAASATIDILNEPQTQINVIEIGRYIKTELEKYDQIKEIRQYGLMIAIEFVESNLNKNLTQLIVNDLKISGILVLVAGYNNQYIRLLPPLTITHFEINEFIEQFKLSLLLNNIHN